MQQNQELIQADVVNEKIPRKDDLLWKGLLEDIFDDFLLFFFPQATEMFDFSKGFVFLNQELEQLFPPDKDLYAPKVVDKLVKVFRKNGQEEWVLIHIEFQSAYRKDFAKRMFTYFYRIFDRYQKPVTAFAILTDGVTRIRDNCFKLSCLGTEMTYRYNTYQISLQDEAKLAASDNPFALAVLTAKAALSRKGTSVNDLDGFLLDIKLKLAKDLLTKKIGKTKIRVLLNFLRYYVRFSNPENYRKFEQEFDKITERSKTMGLEELLLDRAEKQGIAKGEARGAEKEKAEIAKHLKNKGIEVKIISEATGLSVDEIEKL
ncbi:Rpn family recombination-promoting nuclease/putative transposase [Pedobacter faecalis]|uniref:Rpn family recombination-promoting nuclease/putative transposase n=1 Tax=Pedobacter faecalis TaxID=3041495 RepID=UPI002550BC00|nr:Rpn family recombination-promoting nuclease/putative transposase [Pedobacter sp. ELA7]